MVSYKFASQYMQARWCARWLGKRASVCVCAQKFLFVKGYHHHRAYIRSYIPSLQIYIIFVGYAKFEIPGRMRAAPICLFSDAAASDSLLIYSSTLYFIYRDDNDNAKLSFHHSSTTRTFAAALDSIVYTRAETFIQSYLYLEIFEILLSGTARRRRRHTFQLNGKVNEKKRRRRKLK